MSKKEKNGKPQRLKHLKRYVVLVMGALPLALILLFFTGTTDEENQRYLLSAAFQGLAAIYALVLTLVFVGVQLLTSKYSYRAINTLLKGWSLETIIISYLLGLSLLLYYLNNVPVSSEHMKGAMITTIFLILLSGMFIYSIFHSLKPKRVLGLLEKEENLSEAFQLFSDIVSRAITDYDTETAKEGIRIITNLYIKKNARKEDEKTAEEFYRHLKMYLILSKKAGNDWITIEIVRNTCRVMLEGYRVGKSSKISIYFSSLLSETIEENRESGTIFNVLGEISDACKSAGNIVREREKHSFYIDDMIKILIEASEKFYEEPLKNISILRFLGNKFYDIAKGYAKGNMKDLKRETNKIVKYLIYFYSKASEHKFYNGSNYGCYSIYDIVEAAIENQKDGKITITIIKAFVNGCLKCEGNSPSNLSRALEAMEYFIKLCKLTINKEYNELMEEIFNHIDSTFNEKQKNVFCLLFRKEADEICMKFGEQLCSTVNG